MKPELVVDEKEHKAKVEIEAHKVDTLKYVERKLEDKGLHRLERHPSDGAGIRKPPPKSGHGGKYTWEGPEDLAEAELSPPPPAIDPKDPNYVEDGVIEEEEEVAELVKGSVEVAKVAEDREGVTRVEVHHAHHQTY